MKKGCLIFSIILFLFSIALAVGVWKSTESVKNHGATPTSSMTLKEFDSKSWEQYKELYEVITT